MPPNAPHARSMPRDRVVIRFAGDSGDGMNLTALRFAAAASQAGDDVRMLAIPPLEIRAPAGAITAVAAHQVHFGRGPLFTPGDAVDVLVAMNPAALKLHLGDVAPGGLLIANGDAFNAAELNIAGYTSNPLTDRSLSSFDVMTIAVGQLNSAAVAKVKFLSPREVDRSRNLFVLGLVCCLFDRPIEPALKWIRAKFAKNPAIVDANTRAVEIGCEYGKNLPPPSGPLKSPPRIAGRYRRVSGNEALSLGLVAAAQQMKRRLVFASFPMIPATELQQHIAELIGCGVRAVQAEDESAAAGMAIGAAFAGGIGVTVTSGPGLCLMGETLGLAVVAELPLVVIDVMRAGPGNGVPTASDQADLFQAVYGRNGDSPVVVLAPTSPADGFATALLAVRLAIEAMTPVVVLADTHLGNASEIWRTPTLGEMPRFAAHGQVDDGGPAWITPGTPGGEHRQSGLEKSGQSGSVSADPWNHERNVARRWAKIGRLADVVPPTEVLGDRSGELLVVGWGSAAGTIRAAVTECRTRGVDVSAAILTSLHPFPSDFEPILRSFRSVVVAELNSGQLASMVRSKFAIDARQYNKVQGRPFTVAELIAAIDEASHEDR